MGIACFVFIVICIIEGIMIHILLKKEKDGGIKAKIDFFRSLWGHFVIYVLATSVIGLFLGSIYFKQIIGLNEINSWVSIVLGLVALIIGIISLFLSFYNVDQSVQSQKDSIEIMEKVKKEIQEKINVLDSAMREEFKDLHKEVTDYKGKENKKVEPDEFAKNDWGEY